MARERIAAGLSVLLSPIFVSCALPLFREPCRIAALKYLLFLSVAVRGSRRLRGFAGAAVGRPGVVRSGRAAGLLCKLWDRHYGRIPDFLILEGPEAGGHLGFSRQDLDAPPSLSDLLREVLTAIAPFRDKAGRDIPVFVAGGVKNGADMARYMKEGAAGAQFATRFIATAECDASEGYKQRLLAAKADDITLVKSPVGMPGRALRSPLIQRVEAGTQPSPERCVKCIVTCDGKNAPYCISKALIAARNGDWENGLFFCGAAGGEVNTLSTVPEQMAQIMNEWRAAQ